MKPREPSRSLREKLAELSKSAAGSVVKSGGRVAGLGHSVGNGLGERVRALQEAAPGKAADLRARVKASLEGIARDPAQIGHSLGSKVEALLKPRPAPYQEVKDAPVDAVELRAVTPVAEAEVVIEGRQGNPVTVEGRLPVDVIGSVVEIDSGSSLAERTRTFGRVGLTAVHARLGTIAKARKREAADPVVAPAGPTQGAAIHRIESALPKMRLAVPTASGSTDTFGRTAIAQPTIAPAFDVKRVGPQTARIARAQRRDTGRRRLAIAFGTLLTAAVTAGVIHIVTIFAIPLLGTGSAFDYLRWQLTPNKMQVILVDPSASLNKTPPFLSPDMRYAFCRYDISSGPVAVAAVLPEVGWSLALYTPQGDNYYATPGQEGRPLTVEFIIVPASDRLINLAPGVRRADVNATQVTSPQREGLIVVRAPNKGAAYEASTQAALSKASCQAVARR